MPNEQTHFTTLYKCDSRNNTRIWRCTVESIPAGAITRVEHGMLHGAIQTNEKITTHGKNTGKTNATTPYTQAVSDARSVYNKKLDDGYVDNIEDLGQQILRPMLAHEFIKHHHKLTYPILVQPKLRGVRCMAQRHADGSVTLWSRNGKKYTELPHIARAVQDHVPLDTVLDGELYTHGASFQWISSRSKAQHFDSDDLQYWIFDMIDTIPYESRFSALRNMGIDHDILRLTPTFWCPDGHAMQFHTRFIHEGYEGLIARDPNISYQTHKRSYALQKLKTPLTDDYRIVGYTSGTGLHEGCIIYVCETPNCNRFRVVPKGTLDERRNLMSNAESLIGKYLRVQYYTLSTDGVPIENPVGLEVI